MKLCLPVRIVSLLKTTLQYQKSFSLTFPKSYPTSSTTFSWNSRLSAYSKLRPCFWPHPVNMYTFCYAISSIVHQLLPVYLKLLIPRRSWSLEFHFSFIFLIPRKPPGSYMADFVHSWPLICCPRPMNFSLFRELNSTRKPSAKVLVKLPRLSLTNYFR